MLKMAPLCSPFVKGCPASSAMGPFGKGPFQGSTSGCMPFVKAAKLQQIHSSKAGHVPGMVHAFGTAVSKRCELRLACMERRLPQLQVIKVSRLWKSEEQTYHFKTVEESVLDKKTDHPLFSLDGITPLHVRGDSLHILFSRGVANHLSGSLIHYVIYFDWPRRQKISANNRLQTLFARIKELYSEASVSARLTHLRLSMICDATNPFKGYPCLEAKAAETKHFLPCLESVLNEILDPAEDPIHITMKEAIHALNQAVRHYDNMDAFLTATEYATGQNFVKRFFDAYQDLNSWALAKAESCSISPTNFTLLCTFSKTQSF